MRLLATENRVIVYPDPTGEQVLESGIVLPDGLEERRAAKTGTVLSSANRRSKSGTVFAANVFEGDRVAWHPMAGQEIRFGNGKFLVLAAEEIVAVVG